MFRLFNIVLFLFYFLLFFCLCFCFCFRFVQLCPRASEASCADLARSLAREGRVVIKGLSKGGEIERGKAWVLLSPEFFRHNVMGGIFRAGLEGGKKREVGEGAGDGDGDGVVSAANISPSVIG